ncbi:hypothetical protein HOLleu_25118 [Holothuria leucospilota]|uniref:Uncharacterized protein n=1 Tax=Holothuria leucospilota TaxID=206669 RepID=A0A9Q1BRL9_HOLLE|nr:hypothetical protein HOLleu_25118 [Holothuria leucospilota]
MSLKDGGAWLLCPPPRMPAKPVSRDPFLKKIGGCSCNTDYSRSKTDHRLLQKKKKRKR